MEEFIYDKTKYINKKGFYKFEDLMIKYNFYPEEIKNSEEFCNVFLCLMELTNKFPNFLPPYEYVLSMFDCFVPISKTQEEEKQAEVKSVFEKWIQACEKIALEEDIFSKKVEWFILENRPLIRGLVNKANFLWESGKLAEAHDLFDKIYKTNPNDNVGVRYSLKATSEGMSLKEFDQRFIVEDKRIGNYYKEPELSDWYGPEEYEEEA